MLINVISHVDGLRKLYATGLVRRLSNKTVFDRFSGFIGFTLVELFDDRRQIFDNIGQMEPTLPKHLSGIFNKVAK